MRVDVARDLLRAGVCEELETGAIDVHFVDAEGREHFGERAVARVRRVEVGGAVGCVVRGGVRWSVGCARDGRERSESDRTDETRGLHEGSVPRSFGERATRGQCGLVFQ
jgi:hypothetical protein